MPYGIVIPEFLKGQLLRQSYEVADQEEAGLRRELEVLAGRLGLDQSRAGVGEAATVSFVEERGRQVEVIRRRGRLADLIAVAKPDRDRNLGFNTLKAALFNSGRPVLMCPPRADATDDDSWPLGARVAFAWNGSAEAARALSQCVGVLGRADQVWILSNGEDAGPGTSAEDAVAYLRLHGVSASVEPFAADRRIGRALLAAAAGVGADMLLMGAYGDSHELETVFGGNTQTVVDTATMPVLFNH